MIIYGFLFLSSLLLVTALTPVTIRLALKIGAVDVPSDRKVHQEVIPRLGGVAVILAVLLALLLGGALNPYVSHDLGSTLSGIGLGLLVLLVAGLWDDTRNMNPFIKLFFQLGAATVAALSGVQFALASNPLVVQVRDYFDLGWLALPLSILWIVALTNAMNLIDGLDGLATGIALFTSLTLFFVSINMGMSEVAYPYCALIGATLGFLRYNRFPARVFLGDTGSMFLGFTLACLSVVGFHKSFTLSSLIVPVIIFGIPLFDSVMALTRRYYNQQSITEADRGHLHHRLLDLGMTQRQVVLLLYFITVLLGIIAFAFTVQLNEYAAVVILIIGVVGGLLARELKLFGIEPRQMERRYRQEQSQDAAPSSRPGQ